MEVNGKWLCATPVSSAAKWSPLNCSFDMDHQPGTAGVTMRVEGFFDGQVNDVRLYNHGIGPREMADLFSDSDPSALAWQHHYFASTPDEWAGDEDGDGPMLGYGGSFIADSPVMQLIPHVTSEHPEIRFNRRIDKGGRPLNYEVQASRDLVHWAPLHGAEVSEAPSTKLPGFEEIVFRADAPAQAGQTLYARVQLP